MSNEFNDAVDLDLGIDVVVPNDLFSQFHKAQAEGKTAELNNGDAAPDGLVKPPVTPAGQTPKPTAPTSTTPADDTKEPLDNAAILEMARLAALGQGGGNDANDDEDLKDSNTEGTARKKAAQAAAPSNDQYQILYDHFIDELGFEPLSEEEIGEGGMTDETYIAWHQKNVETQGAQRAEQIITEAFANQKQNEPLAKDFFRFISNGGQIQDFLETRKDDSFGNEYLTGDLEDDELESRSENVMRTYLTSIGWDQEAVDKNIKTLKGSGSLNAMAESTLPQFIKMRDNRKAIADQSAIQQKAQTEKVVREYNTKLFSIIDTATEFGSFTFKSPKQRQEIKEYMFAPTVDDGHGNKIPQYLADLQKAKANPAFTLHQALSLKNGSIDLDGVKQKATNQATTALKDKLLAAAQGKKLEPGQSGPSNTSSPRSTAQELLNFDKIEFA